MHPSLKQRFTRFLAELKRRRVPQTALWYIGASVAVVEAANLFLPSFGAPAGTARLLAILAVFGLPIALTLAWVFDISDASAEGTSPARGLRIALLGSVALVSIAGAFYVWRRNPQPEMPTRATAPAADPARVAVLGFTTVGGDAELEAFAAQLHARLIDGLSEAALGTTPGVKRLRVISRASILPFATGTVSVDSVRRAFNVGTLLEGSVERSGAAMRVRVRLVDTETGDQLRATVAEARANDRVALLDAVADSVVRVIRQQLGPIVRDRMRLLETRNPDAFDLFSRAMQQAAEFDAAFNAKDYERGEHALADADSLFAEAERLDRRWIEPIIERGRLAKRRERLDLARQTPVHKTYDVALGHAARALALKPDDWRALELRGDLRADYARHLREKDSTRARELRDAAEHDLRAALNRNPTPARTLRILSELAGGAGRFEEAITYGERAHNEDPYLEETRSILFRLYEYSFALGRDDAAAEWCAKGRARFAKLATFQDCRLALAAWSKAYGVTSDSAWLLVGAQLRSHPAPLVPLVEPRLHAMAAAVLARNGQPDSARTVLRAAYRPDNVTTGFLRAAAGVYSLLGEADSAVSVVRQLIIAAPSDRSRLDRLPELRALTGDPRIRELSATNR